MINYIKEREREREHTKSRVAATYENYKVAKKEAKKGSTRG